MWRGQKVPHFIIATSRWAPAPARQSPVAALGKDAGHEAAAGVAAARWRVSAAVDNGLLDAQRR